jgi:hypothetical protein
MSLQNALNFLTKIDTDEPFRKSCYKCKSKTELLERLNGLGFAFTLDEYGNAINQMLLKCQTEDQGNHVKELEIWFSLFP